MNRGSKLDQTTIGFTADCPFLDLKVFVSPSYPFQPELRLRPDTLRPVFFLNPSGSVHRLARGVRYLNRRQLVQAIPAEFLCN